MNRPAFQSALPRFDVVLCGWNGREPTVKALSAHGAALTETELSAERFDRVEPVAMADFSRAVLEVRRRRDSLLGHGWKQGEPRGLADFPPPPKSLQPYLREAWVPGPDGWDRQLDFRWDFDAWESHPPRLLLEAEIRGTKRGGWPTGRSLTDVPPCGTCGDATRFVGQRNRGARGLVWKYRCLDKHPVVSVAQADVG